MIGGANMAPGPAGPAVGPRTRRRAWPVLPPSAAEARHRRSSLRDHRRRTRAGQLDSAGVAVNFTGVDSAKPTISVSLPSGPPWGEWLMVTTSWYTPGVTALAGTLKRTEYGWGSLTTVT